MFFKKIMIYPDKKSTTNVKKYVALPLLMKLEEWARNPLLLIPIFY